jgi:hypothetical protein
MSSAKSRKFGTDENREAMMDELTMSYAAIAISFLTIAISLAVMFR